METDPLISACVIVRNEERLIERCLKSIEDVVDEIIVVHDGECGDRTLSVAEKYTGKIYVRDFGGSAEVHRPFAHRKAKGNWTLMIDADEYLSDELKTNLRRLIRLTDVSAYAFSWPIWDPRKGTNYLGYYKTCLFRKDKVKCLSLPHTVSQVEGKVRTVDFVLEHRPEKYIYTWASFKSRQSERAKISARLQMTDFRKVDKYNIERDDWPLTVRFRVRFPLIAMPLDVITVLFDHVIKKRLWGLRNFNIALMYAYYRLLVDYYLFKLRRLEQK
jgi:glycosyltransferase involved in cell wall biosynthesis